MPPETRLEHVNDLPPDLPRLRTLETWLAMSLDRVRQQIAAVEQQGKGQATAKQPEEPKPPRPRTPDWGIVGVGTGTPITEIHRGDCWAAGKALREVSRERAVAELADGARSCDVCRPDTALGAP